jgi:hypothetical protein
MALSLLGSATCSILDQGLNGTSNMRIAIACGDGTDRANNLASSTLKRYGCHSRKRERASLEGLFIGRCFLGKRRAQLEAT